MEIWQADRQFVRAASVNICPWIFVSRSVVLSDPRRKLETKNGFGSYVYFGTNGLQMKMCPSCLL